MYIAVDGAVGSRGDSEAPYRALNCQKKTGGDGARLISEYVGRAWRERCRIETQNTPPIVFS